MNLKSRDKWKNKIFIILIIIGFAIIPLNAQQIPPIKGKITNLKGQPIQDVTVIIESDTKLVKQKTDKDGRFSFWLPDGIYKIYTESWIGRLNYKNDFYMPEGYSSYFRPVSRANIQLSSKDSLTINFILIETKAILVNYNSKSNEIFGFGNEYFDSKPTSKIKYETIITPESLDEGLDLVIQFGSRITEKGNIIYKTVINLGETSVFGKESLGVVITYNNFTLYTDKVVFDKKNSLLSTSENVVVENGKEQFQVKKAKILIKKGKPIFAFEK